MHDSALLQLESPVMKCPSTMRAVVFRGAGDLSLESRPIPHARSGEAVVRMTLTTICGTDIHILKGEYPVSPGRIIGHELVGTIHELGPGVQGYETGERVLVGAITPCGQCSACLSGNSAQCGNEPMGGWKLGNTMDGAQAEYVLIPAAQANMAKIPPELSDDQVLLLADVASTGFSALETADLQLGDTVIVLAQGPIGLCATVGAKLKGAAFIVTTESNQARQSMSKQMGADVVLDPTKCDVVSKVRELTSGRGMDVAVEALGTQATFETALRSLRPGGTLSSLGVYSGKLTIPADGFAAGIGDYKIVTTLCPGGKERMRRLMELVLHDRVDLRPLITHFYPLERIGEAYTLFESHANGVLKIAIRP